MPQCVLLLQVYSPRSCRSICRSGTQDVSQPSDAFKNANFQDDRASQWAGVTLRAVSGRLLQRHMYCLQPFSQYNRAELNVQYNRASQWGAGVMLRAVGSWLWHPQIDPDVAAA